MKLRLGGLVVALVLLHAGAARAQDSILTNVAPAFRPGPYTLLKVDPSDPERFVVGTSDGWVLETRDGGGIVSESHALLARTYYPMVLRGLGGNKGSQLGQARHPWMRGATRLFISQLHAGMTPTRWSPWMAQEDPSTDIFDIALSPPGGHGAVAGPNGVFISDERMTVWTRAIGYPRPKANVTTGFAAAFDPGNRKLMFVGTSDGMFVSWNGGESFSRHPDKKLADETVRQILWDPKDPNLVMLIAGPTVYKSENHGETFDAVLSGESDVNAVAQADEGVYVATGKGLSLYTGEGTKEMLKEDAVVGVVPVGQGAVLAATESTLFLVDADGKRQLMSTNAGDPFIKLAGSAELAWALTKYGIYRIGAKEPRAHERARHGPQMLMTLDEVQRATLEHMGIGDPTRSRLSDRWYAQLLPTVSVFIVGGTPRSSAFTYDATFPVGYRYANASLGSNFGGGGLAPTPEPMTSNPTPTVMLHWDLAKIFFGPYGNVTMPLGLVETGLRSSRVSILEEVRWRYREIRNLCALLRYPPTDAKTLLMWNMRIEEYASYIEALSGKKVVALDNTMEEAQ